MIQLEQVCKSYKEKQVLFDISFNFNTNQVVGLLGNNGAGKTTLIRLITGWHFPEKGKVLIDGYDTKGSDFCWKKNIGYLPEKTPLYEKMLVKDFLIFGANIHGIKKKDALNALDSVVQKFSLSSVLFQPISSLSHGFRQRVCFAFSLIHNPKILILDEPSNGLDPHQILETREIIKSLSKSVLVLFSTHIISEAENVCSRVLILNNGILVANDTVDNLKNQTNVNSLEQAFFVLTVGSNNER